MKLQVPTCFGLGQFPRALSPWPAEVTKLAELHEPLFDYIERTLVPSGERTARVHYGAAGWVVHHISDPWGFTTPGDGVWGVWPMGSAWLARHFWEQYAFGGDRVFLEKRAWPVIKGAAQFVLGFLVEDRSGRLVTNPSHSPENAFYLPDGTESRFTYAATMDLEIVRDLFTSAIEASRTLGVDAPLRAKLEAALTRLPPLRISAETRRLQEWIEDYREVEPGHRHMSHLFAVYPGREITLRGTPALAAAARQSLDDRLSHKGGQTGWSRAWIVNFFARFEDGPRALESLVALLRENTARRRRGGGPVVGGRAHRLDAPDGAGRCPPRANRTAGPRRARRPARRGPPSRARGRDVRGGRRRNLSTAPS